MPLWGVSHVLHTSVPEQNKANNDQRYQQQGIGPFSNKYRAFKQGDVPCTVQKNSEFRNNHMILLSVLTKDL